ncbi:high mobility group [Coemansia sp. RSA 2708]|nr:high mobility group [Coemansia sp. RSA 2708]
MTFATHSFQKHPVYRCDSTHAALSPGSSSGDEAAGAASALPAALALEPPLPPAMSALIRESEAIAAMAYRIGQHFRRYTQLLAEIREPHPSLGADSEAASVLLDTGHCFGGPKHPGQPGALGANAHGLLAEAKPAGKRPLSDFNFFCRDARKLVVEVHPEYTKEQVNKELGRIWAMLDRQSRQYYRSLYVQDKLRYSQDVASLATPPELRPVDAAAAAAPPLMNPLNARRLSAGDEARQTIWRCITAPASSNTIQSILNKALSPEASDRADESEDLDEPLASVLLRGHAQTLAPPRPGVSDDRRAPDSAGAGYRWPAQGG